MQHGYTVNVYGIDVVYHHQIAQDLHHCHFVTSSKPIITLFTLDSAINKMSFTTTHNLTSVVF